MENKTELPKEYTPFDEIIICGNKLIKVNKIINDKGFIPMIIGVNKENNKPLIWLNAKSGSQTIKLVSKNIPMISLIEVNEYFNKSQIDIVFNNNNEKYLIMQIENVGQVPEITNLDLRPFGYKIFGDSESLNIGNNQMVNSTFQAETLLAL